MVSMDPNNTSIDIRGPLLGLVVGGMIGFGLGVKAPTPKPKVQTVYRYVSDALNAHGPLRVIGYDQEHFTMVDTNGVAVSIENGIVQLSTWKVGDVINAERP
jgi:hypothetical protein